MKFSYKARTKNGVLQSGIIEALSYEVAVTSLSKKGFFVTEIIEKKDTESFWRRFSLIKKIPKKELVIFFRELSVMLQSRVPVVQSITILAQQAENRNFKDVLEKIATSVEQGISLSDAMDSYPKIFSPFYVNLIKSGEASGKISEALFYISESLERDDDVNAQVRQALIYPLFLLGVLVIVIGVIIVEVMPKISDLIVESGTTPSSFISLVLKISVFLQNFWWLLALILSLIVILLIYYFSTDIGKKYYDYWSLKMPFFGNLLKKVFLTRFCGNVSTLLVAGISINRALEITQDTIDNSLYREMITAISRNISEGEKMSLAMQKYPAYFPLFILQIVKVGEETGKLDRSLLEVVNFYQKDIKRSIDLFTRFLEPLMIVFLGVIVLILAISVLSSLYGAVGTI